GGNGGFGIPEAVQRGGPLFFWQRGTAFSFAVLSGRVLVFASATKLNCRSVARLFISALADVRFGSKGDIHARSGDVRLTSESGRRSVNWVRFVKYVRGGRLLLTAGALLF